MWKKFCFPILMFLVLALGCGKQATTPEEPDDSDGFFTAVELPDGYFPDDNFPGVPEQILEKYQFPGAGADDLDWVLPTSIPPDMDDSAYDVYSVTMLWGSFSDGNSNGDPIDWSGSAWLNAEGQIDVKYLIDFEPGEDSLIPVNATWHAVWLSQTHNDFDGISFFIFLRNDVDYITPPVLTFETEAITLQFDFGQLSHLDGFYPVGDHSGVAIHSRRLWHEDCPHGFLSGNWIKGDFGLGEGVLQGFWYDGGNIPIGHLNGAFWQDGNATGKFHGWVTGLETDEVIAELHGVWHYDDQRLCPMCGEGHGQFYGMFQNVSNDRRGWVRGQFGDYSIPPDDAVMPFEGHWRDFCPDNQHSDFMHDWRQ